MMERYRDDGFCLNRVVVFPADANGRWIQRVAALLMVGLLFSGCGGGGGGGEDAGLGGGVVGGG